MEHRSQIFSEAFWENISEKIFGALFTDLQRSLLRKYFRRIYWNGVRRSSVKPSGKIFQRRYLEHRSQIFSEAFWENISEKIFGAPFTDLQRSLLRKYFREDIWNSVYRSSAKPSEKIFWKRYLEHRLQIFSEAF